MTPENTTRTSEYPIPRVFTTLPYLQSSLVTFACLVLVLERAHLPHNAQGPSTRAGQDYFNAPHTTTHWITITKLVVKPYRATWLSALTSDMKNTSFPIQKRWPQAAARVIDRP